MAVGARDTGRTRNAEPIYEITDDVPATPDATNTELQDEETAAIAVLAVVQAMKNLTAAHGAQAVSEAQNAVRLMENDRAAVTVLARAQARKDLFTDALAAVAALP